MGTYLGLQITSTHKGNGWCAWVCEHIASFIRLDNVSFDSKAVVKFREKGYFILWNSVNTCTINIPVKE